MSRSRINPYTRIRQLESQLCCLRRELTQTITASLQTIEIEDGVLAAGCSFEIYFESDVADLTTVNVLVEGEKTIEEVLEQLNTVFAGFAVFTFNEGTQTFTAIVNNTTVFTLTIQNEACV